MVAAIILLILALGAAAAFMLFAYMSQRGAPPKTYFDYQLRIHRETLRRKPKDPGAWTNVGYLYLKMGDDSRALTHFDKALALDKNFVGALYNKGMYFEKKGRDEEARPLLERAGKYAAPGNKYIAFFSLGEMDYNEKKYDSAIKYLDKASVDNATIWNVFELRGRIYEIKKEPKKALADYERGAMFNPTDTALQKKIKRLKGGANNG